MLKKYIVLIALSLVLMTSDKVFDFSSVKSVLQIPLTPVSYGLYSVGYTVSGITRFIASLPSVYSENSRLKNELVQRQRDLIKLDELTEENEALRQQLHVVDESRGKKLMASVVGVDDTGESLLLLIDKGARDGVAEDMVVVRGGYLIGRIIKVGRVNSYVLPIISTGSRVPVQVIRSGEGVVGKGLLVGRFNKDVLLTEVLQEYKINKGDTVVVSGEGGVYPAGLFVGTVAEILSRDNELFKRAAVELPWSMGDLRTVFVDIE